MKEKLELAKSFLFDAVETLEDITDDDILQGAKSSLDIPAVDDPIYNLLDEISSEVSSLYHATIHQLTHKLDTFDQKLKGEHTDES
jgi:hypothetical protein